VLDIIAASAGSLNFNDALLVPLQREGSISEVASFDGGFDVLPTFVRVTDL
jgi:predicted nucleic acid-binding protein